MKDSTQPGGPKTNHARLSKNITIFDYMDRSTREIITPSTVCGRVEKRLRDSNNYALDGMHPIRHWKSSKIRRHLFRAS